MTGSARLTTTHPGAVEAHSPLDRSPPLPRGSVAVAVSGFLHHGLAVLDYRELFEDRRVDAEHRTQDVGRYRGDRLRQWHIVLRLGGLGVEDDQDVEVFGVA